MAAASLKTLNISNLGSMALWTMFSGDVDRLFGAMKSSDILLDALGAVSSEKVLIGGSIARSVERGLSGGVNWRDGPSTFWFVTASLCIAASSGISMVMARKRTLGMRRVIWEDGERVTWYHKDAERKKRIRFDITINRRSWS
jgi:hypothetical protein